MYIVVGLGNPGEEYENTRHNVGRMLVEQFRGKHNFPEWRERGKKRMLISEDKVGKEKTILMLPETFMNKSGIPLKEFITNKKKAEKLVVVYDDIDLPLGSLKISFGRGSGGHKGLESIIRTIKTKDFTRIRIGITPTTPSGKLKKPKGEKKMLDFIIGDFKTVEKEILKKKSKKVLDAIETIIVDGRARAMNMFN